MFDPPFDVKKSFNKAATIQDALYCVMLAVAQGRYAFAREMVDILDEENRQDPCATGLTDHKSQAIKIMRQMIDNQFVYENFNH